MNIHRSPLSGDAVPPWCDWLIIGLLAVNVIISIFSL